MTIEGKEELLPLIILFVFICVIAWLACEVIKSQLNSKISKHVKDARNE